MMKYHVPLLLVVFTVAGNLHAQKKDPPTFEKARDAIIDARKKIDTCVIEMVIKDESRDPKTERTYRVWWDEKHQRMDMIPSDPEPVIRYVYCVNCEEEGWGLQYYEEENLLAEFKPLKDFENDLISSVIDPKLIGQGFSVASFQVSIDKLIARRKPDIAKVSIIAGPDGDLLQIKWTYEDPNIWFKIVADPNRGYEITEMESKGKDFRELIRCQLKKWGKTWYPEKMTFEQWFGTKKSTFLELTVKSAKFNEPIPPEAFTLAGIKMLPGHVIRVGDEPGLFKVVEGKIVPLKPNRPQRRPFLPPVKPPVKPPVPPKEKPPAFDYDPGQ